jgi:hypothetical protein
VKASEVDRRLSMKALAESLGAFQAPGEQARSAPANTSYRRQERPHGPAATLYAAFQAEREAAIKARADAMAALRQRHAEHALRLRGWYRDRYIKVRATTLPSWLRRQSYQHLACKRREDHAERITREAEERRRTRALHPLPSWQTWLENAAARGDGAALAALRVRRQRQQRMETALLTVEDARAARDIVHAHLKPIVRSDGRVIYRVEDGGVVMDEARHVRVSQVTVGSAWLALSLAAERFGDRPLVVNGTEDFRRRVAALAAVEGLRVTFADATLEQQRLMAERRRRDERGRDGAERGR